VLTRQSRGPKSDDTTWQKGESPNPVKRKASDGHLQFKAPFTESKGGYVARGKKPSEGTKSYIAPQGSFLPPTGEKPGGEVVWKSPLNGAAPKACH